MADAARNTADLPEPRSHFVAVGLLGSLVRAEGEWDSGFGGELIVGAVCEGCILSAWAAGLGLVGFSARSGGRASAGVAAGTRWPTGILIGVSGGPVVQLDDLRRPRLGGETSFWLHAGVVPYVRVGAVEESGVFMDLGLRIPLPAARW
jgi:hypothetical protein